MLVRLREGTDLRDVSVSARPTCSTWQAERHVTIRQTAEEVGQTLLESLRVSGATGGEEECLVPCPLTHPPARIH